jgi:hypothetical protein
MVKKQYNAQLSTRTDERLRYLARLLRRYKDVQVVADFLDQYRDLSLPA